MELIPVKALVMINVLFSMHVEGEPLLKDEYQRWYPARF
jgi:hypothetical protein